MTAIDHDVNAAKRMFDVNVFGPMRMVHHFHDMIIRAKGAIVNIGSIGGIIPYLYGCESSSSLELPGSVPSLLIRGLASYNATKAALQHWSNTLRVEMSPFESVLMPQLLPR